MQVCACMSVLCLCSIVSCHVYMMTTRIACRWVAKTTRHPSMKHAQSVTSLHLNSLVTCSWKHMKPILRHVNSLATTACEAQAFVQSKNKVWLRQSCQDHQTSFHEARSTALCRHVCICPITVQESDCVTSLHFKNMKPKSIILRHVNGNVTQALYQHAWCQ